MDAVTPLAPGPEQPDSTQSVSPSERRCLATGEVLPKEAMLRFVVGPDHVLVPDLAETLPGRGLWVKTDKDTVALAAQKNLFAKSAKAPVQVPTDLLTQLPLLMRKRCLDFLGLSKRAGVAILGQPQVESALRAHKLSLLLLADDAQQELDSRTTLPIIRIFSRTELGAALGYAQIVYLGLQASPLTKKIRAEIERLGKFTSHPQIQ